MLNFFFCMYAVTLVACADNILMNFVLKQTRYSSKKLHDAKIVLIYVMCTTEKGIFWGERCWTDLAQNT